MLWKVVAGPHEGLGGYGRGGEAMESIGGGLQKALRGHGRGWGVVEGVGGPRKGSGPPKTPPRPPHPAGTPGTAAHRTAWTAC